MKTLAFSLGQAPCHYLSFFQEYISFFLNF